jgi:hypothetical protein
MTQDAKEPETREVRYTVTKNINALSFDCGVRNLAYCLVEDINLHDREFSIKLWENFSLNNFENASDAVNSLYKELDKREWMKHVDHVVIEAQVSQNAVMKVIAHSLQMYFLCRRATTVENSVTTYKPMIHFVSPKSKFSVTNVPEPRNSPAPGHARNKRIAIDMACKLLASPKDRFSLDFLNSHTKKDDLADSFLQAVYFLRAFREKQRKFGKIRAHLGREINIVEEENEKLPIVFRSNDFVVPSFDIADVGTSQVFQRPSPQ